MSSMAREVRSMTTDEVRNVSVDMSGKLDVGELLIGTPTIQAADALTITNQQVNPEAVEINGVSVAAGMAVQMTVDPAARGNYRIEILCTTDKGQTIEGAIKLSVGSGQY